MKKGLLSRLSALLLSAVLLSGLSTSAFAQEQSGYAVYNPVRRIGVRVSWNHADLPYFCQWKMLGKGEYVLGMEPLNAPLDGKKIGEEGCLAPILQPGESKTYSLHFSFIEEL